MRAMVYALKLHTYSVFNIAIHTYNSPHMCICKCQSKKYEHIVQSQYVLYCIHILFVLYITHMYVVVLTHSQTPPNPIPSKKEHKINNRQIR